MLLLVQECSQRTTRKELGDDAEDWGTAACPNKLQNNNLLMVLFVMIRTDMRSGKLVQDYELLLAWSYITMSSVQDYDLLLAWSHRTTY